MSQNLVGLSGVDGFSGCSPCGAARRAGMAGFGAGPDGLGTVVPAPEMARSAAERTLTLTLGGVLLGLAVGAAMRKRGPALMAWSSGAGVLGAYVSVALGYSEAAKLKILDAEQAANQAANARHPAASGYGAYWK